MRNGGAKTDSSHAPCLLSARYLDDGIVGKQAAGIVAAWLNRGRGGGVEHGGACVLGGAEQGPDDGAAYGNGFKRGRDALTTREAMHDQRALS